MREGLSLLEAGSIRPHLDRTFPLGEAVAHEYIDSRKTKRHVVLLPWA